MANPVLAILSWPIWANPILANPNSDLVCVCHGGAKRWGLEREVAKGDGPKISRFSFALSRPIFVLFVSDWVSSR